MFVPRVVTNFDNTLTLKPGEGYNGIFGFIKPALFPSFLED